MTLPTIPPRPRQRIRTSTLAKASTSLHTSEYRKLQIQHWSITRIKPYVRKLRKHAKDQQQHLQRNIRAFKGPVCPILVDREGTIVSGHALYEALKALGVDEVGVIVIDDLDPDQVKALRISINKIQEMSSWDADELRHELAYLYEVNVDLVVNTALSTVEVDVLLNPSKPDDKSDPADLLPETSSEAPVVTVPGDIWIFKSGHMLGCGDSRAEEIFTRMLGARRARLIVADVPYNRKVKGHITSRALREFVMATGEMTPEEFIRFLRMIFENLIKYSLNGSLHLVFIDWLHVYEMVSAGRGLSTLR